MNQIKKEESSSTSSEELDGTSERFNPLKALYSQRPNPSLANAPLYDNLQLFLSAQERKDVFPVGHSSAVAQRQEEKQKARDEKEKELLEKNRRRFTEAQAPITVPRPQRAQKDVLKRVENICGPLSALRDCMENKIRVKVQCMQRWAPFPSACRGGERRSSSSAGRRARRARTRRRVTSSRPAVGQASGERAASDCTKNMARNVELIYRKLVNSWHKSGDCRKATRHIFKVITRHATGIRGQLIGLLEAFDKQWNMAMSDVLEIWRRKSKMKRKVPPCMGEPCPRGTAAQRAAIPIVTETSVGKNLVECTRHVPQLMVRGEHVVLVQIIERWKRE